MAEITLPWAAWYQDGRHTVKLPDDWQVDLLAPPSPAPWSTRQICDALSSPIESPSLDELAEGCRTACIVVDDLARPTRASDVLPHVLEQLRQGGMPPTAVQIVVATGSHGPLDEHQLRWKVGEHAATQCRVVCHDCHGPLASTGIQYGDQELRINRTFMEADLKLGISSVLPHSFAGYSGGAKLVLPGLTDVTSTARSHKFVQMGLRGGSDPNENRFRLEAEQLARQLGLNFIICVLSDVYRETTGVFAGDLVAAHRRACTVAQAQYWTEITHSYDCLLLNAYPKDIDLIQADNAFVALKTASRPIVRPGGVLVLMTAASEGIGRHGLFQPGGASYREPVKKRMLGDRDLWLYTPGLSSAEVHKLYWDGYPVFQDAAQLRDALWQRFAGEVRAGVLPCAPMQQVRGGEE